MSFAHLTLPTRDVEKTARLLEKTLGYTRSPVPGNSPVEVVWLDIGGGQEMHVFYVEGFEVSPFESEFGRHVAVSTRSSSLRRSKRGWSNRARSSCSRSGPRRSSASFASR